MSRVYPGLYRVLVVLEDGSYDFTAKPDAYEECANLITLLGGAIWSGGFLRTNWNNLRVVKAMVIGPVSGTVAEYPNGGYEVRE